MTFQPRAAGVLRDEREHTDLAAEIPFFGSREAADRFFDVGVAPVVGALPRRVEYVDFGGGQGVLAAVVRDRLVASGRDVHATVLDGNARYLDDAAGLGLGTCLANVQDCTLAGLDLATMRLANHYNNETEQRAMLAAIRRALPAGRPFVTQIETGSAAVCHLYTAIAALLSRDDGAASGYWWPTVDEFTRLLADAGFGDVRVAGFGPDVEVSAEEGLADAWRRFNAFRVAQAAVEPARARELSQRRTEFMHQARRLVAAIVNAPRNPEPAEDLARGFARVSYPILICR